MVSCGRKLYKLTASLLKSCYKDIIYLTSFSKCVPKDTSKLNLCKPNKNVNALGKLTVSMGCFSLKVNDEPLIHVQITL